MSSRTKKNEIENLGIFAILNNSIKRAWEKTYEIDGSEELNNYILLNKSTFRLHIRNIANDITIQTGEEKKLEQLNIKDLKNYIINKSKKLDILTKQHQEKSLEAQECKNAIKNTKLCLSMINVEKSRNLDNIDKSAVIATAVGSFFGLPTNLRFKTVENQKYYEKQSFTNIFKNTFGYENASQGFSYTYSPIIPLATNLALTAVKFPVNIFKLGFQLLPSFVTNVRNAIEKRKINNNDNFKKDTDKASHDNDNQVSSTTGALKRLNTNAMPQPKVEKQEGFDLFDPRYIKMDQENAMLKSMEATVEENKQSTEKNEEFDLLDPRRIKMGQENAMREAQKKERDQQTTTGESQFNNANRRSYLKR